jgi:hypothetical protein
MRRLEAVGGSSRGALGGSRRVRGVLRELRQQCPRVLQIPRVEAFGEPAVDGGEEGAGSVALALALPEPRQTDRGPQLEQLGLLPLGDLQGSAEERLRLRGRIGVSVEEDLRPQSVELGIVEVLSPLGSREAECERAQGVVVAPGLLEALGEQREARGRCERGPDPSQLDQCLLRFRQPHNPWRIQALGPDIARLDLKAILANPQRQTRYNQSDLRMVSMFLWEQGRFKRFLRLIEQREKNGYLTYFEAAMEQPIERIQPLWERYLADVAARAPELLRLPVSTILDDELSYRAFAQTNGLKLPATQ